MMDRVRTTLVIGCILSGWTFLLLLSVARALDGSWATLVQNAGISAMHAQVTYLDNVILLDRTDIGASQILLPSGRCRDNPKDLTLTHDCTAHSVEFTPGPNTVRPLFIFTDTWCSSGQVFLDGTLWQTGGDYDGLQKVRTFTPCKTGTCNWVELTTPQLQAGRWYATNHLLDDGSQIIVGGRSVFTYEYIPDRGRGETQLPLLANTNNFENDNYYPFVNLLPSGYLWIFANRDSIIYDHVAKKVIKTLPRIPGGPRNYPSAGSSVMLPLVYNQNFAGIVQVLVCGGAQLGAFTNPAAQFGAQQTCGRMTLTAGNPVWEMETMPFRRTMGDMLLLPTRDVLIINGAQNGSQGWGDASNAILNPVVYRPGNAPGQRFVIQSPSPIPRVYHSTANLLSDGRILIAGSNTHQFYTFTGVFPTELRLEAFSPGYLSASNVARKPVITVSPASVIYGSTFPLTFTLPGTIAPGAIQVTMASAPFVTHSYAQGQRLLVLQSTPPTKTGLGNSYRITVTAPSNAKVAPGTYYMTFILNSGSPSVAKWIQVHR